MKEELTAEEKLALRKAQWEKAMAGDTKMLIFLGKQYLGQKDTPHENDSIGLHGFGTDAIRLVLPDTIDND